MSPYAREEKNFFCAECFNPIFLPGLCRPCEHEFNEYWEKKHRFEDKEEE